MALRESALNGYSSNGKVLVCIFWRKVRFLKGERGKPIYWCMLFWTNFLLSFLVFFSFLSVFVLIFFRFFSCSVFLFTLWALSSVFSIPFTGHDKGLFIVPAVASVLLFCPLTAFVWSGCTCRSNKTPARQRRAHFVFLCAANSFCPFVRRGLSCLDVNLLSPHTQSMHSTVPSQIAPFGWSVIPAGRTSQKRFEQGPKIDLFPSPHH